MSSNEGRAWHEKKKSRRYKVKKSGVLLRVGCDMGSRQVGELAAGTEVVVTEDMKMSGSTRRVLVETPLRGWCSEKKLEPYGTSHAVPAGLEGPDEGEHVKTVEIKSKHQLREFLKHKEKEKVWERQQNGEAHLKEPQQAYDWEDPYERWVMDQRPGEDPEDPKVRVAYAARLRGAGDLDGAELMLRKALGDEPSLAKARSQLAKVVDAKKRREQALTAALATPEARLADAVAKIKGRADAEFEVRNWRSALHFYGLLLEGMTDEPEVDDDEEVDSEEEAARQERGFRLGRPLRLLDGEVVRAPVRDFDGHEAANLHGNRSACLAKLRKFEEAEEEASRALELRPDWVKGIRRLAVALDGGGRHVEAQFALEHAMSISPNDPGLRAARRNAEIRCEHFERRAMEEALDESKTWAAHLDLLQWQDLVDPEEAPPEIKIIMERKAKQERRGKSAQIFMTDKQKKRVADKKAARRERRQADLDLPPKPERDPDSRKKEIEKLKADPNRRKKDWFPSSSEDEADGASSVSSESSLDSDVLAGDSDSDTSFSSQDSDRYKKWGERSKEYIARDFALRRLRADARLAAAAAAAAEDERRLQRAKDGVEHTPQLLENRLSKKLCAKGLKVSNKGAKVAQSASRVRGACLAKEPLPATGVHVWCVALDGVGQPCLGVATEGCDLAKWLGDDAKAWSLYMRDHRGVMATAHGGSRGDYDAGAARGGMMMGVKKGDAVGFMWDADAKELDVFVNGASKGTIFGPADFPADGALDGDGEPLPPLKLFPAVGFEGNQAESGAYRFIPGVFDDPERLEKLELIKRFKVGRGFSGKDGKNFQLVHADGSRHERMDKPKMAYNMCQVHQRGSGDGVHNTVWCQTEQARWTQSVYKIEVVAFNKPRDVSAQDLDVVLKTRYLKASHRVTGEVYVEGALHRDVYADESLWYVDDDGVLNFMLAKNLTMYHTYFCVSMGNWSRLFEFDEEMSDGDMDMDQTDLDRERKRIEDIASMKSSQQAKYELAKRKRCEDAGLQWHWVHNYDGPNGYQIDPSYEAPGQIGYDMPTDRELVLRQAGCFNGA